jgi:hypothetical protein
MASVVRVVRVLRVVIGTVFSFSMCLVNPGNDPAEARWAARGAAYTRAFGEGRSPVWNCVARKSRRNPISFG